MQFTKNQAVMDFHFTIFGILVILFGFVTYFAWSNSFAGIKYKLLTDYGTTTTMKIIEIEDVNWIFIRQEIKGTKGANTKFTFQFTTRANESVNAIAIVDNRTYYGSGERIIRRLLKKNEIVVGKYLEWNPNLALPTRVLNRLEYSWKLFRNAVFVLFGLIAITIWRIIEYRKLKRQMKYD